MRNLDVEGRAIKEVMSLLSEGPAHVSDITDHIAARIDYVRDLEDSGTPPPKRAYTSSLVNRWTGLGYLDRVQPGVYSASESVQEESPIRDSAFDDNQDNSPKEKSWIRSRRKSLL